MSFRLPDFLIIGAMKSGTTTLHHYLAHNPDIYISKPKEVDYFSQDKNYQRGADWYAELFAPARPEQICGEVSPSYTRFPRFAETPKRIAALLPGVKLIYIMRHPVERFYSNYVYERAYGRTDTIRETLDNRPYVLETSNYMLQINRYLEYFPRDQMLPLLLDDLKRDPDAVISQLLEFLGVTSRCEVPAEPFQANPRGRNVTMRQCNASLQRFRSLPGVDTMKRAMPAKLRGRLRECVTQQLPDTRIARWMANLQTAKTEPLTPELRQEVLKCLAEPTNELSKFLGRDLTSWLD